MTQQQNTEAKITHTFLPLVHYKEHGYKMKNLGQIQDPDDGQYYIQIEQSHSNGYVGYLYFNPQTGLLAKNNDNGNIFIISDYRPVQGIYFAHYYQEAFYDTNIFALVPMGF
jgi:hypothetical protein